MLNFKELIKPYVQILLPRETAERIYKLAYLLIPLFKLNLKELSKPNLHWSPN